MIKFLVTAAIVLVCLFILVLVSCLMVWVVMRLLRWLFPRRFGSKAAPVKKPAAKKKPNYTQLLTPLTRRCWFVTNRDYAAYDTLACVGNLQKSFKEGDILSEEEILSLRRNEQQANMDGVVKPSRKWRRNQKKMYK